ncbi:MAG: transposase [Pirellulales bacterium]|nr:transposase [Pirellulales bacterium]
MAKRHDVKVTDEQWEKIRPHLPERKRNRKGG